MRAHHAAIGLTAVLLASACGTADAEGQDPKPGTRSITVDASDDACTLSAAEAPAGKIQFSVANKGSKVTEFYVYSGESVVGEIENISPGLKRSFSIEVTKPGTYTTACKPGMAGDGIRADFKVTGKAVAGSADSDAKLKAATARYETFVNESADRLLVDTTAFVAAVKANKVAEAKRIYPTARSHWERIEPVAESFGDLDPKIDGREDVVDDGMKFTGYHRLEKDLWVTGLQKDSSAIADQLLTDVTTVVTKAKAVEFNPLQLANGSKELLDEMATGKITGEEERYSHTDMWDFYANFEGSRAAMDALKPALEERNAHLAEEVSEKSEALDTLLDTYKTADGGFVEYTKLTKADIKQLSDALDALSEEVAEVSGVISQS